MPRMSPLLAQIYKSRGLNPEIVSRFEDLESWAVETIQSLLADYPLAAQVYQALATDEEVITHWEMANYMTVVKLGYNDHGETHAKIATAYALTILRRLLDNGIELDLIADGLGDEQDAFLVVLIATLLHDIGNQAGRVGHEAISVSLAMPILNRILAPVYPSVARRTRLNACIAHAILSHDLNPPPLTLEAAIVAVGDGADLTKGRGRIAFDLGKVDTHSVSALAIDAVTIQAGEERPVEIFVSMSNAAGIFQVEQTLTKKVLNTPLRDWVAVTAVIQPESDAPSLGRISLLRGKFVVEDGTHG